MFSTKPNIQILTSLLLKSGITEIVLCPGSRNSALVHNFQAAGMKCYNITDERSAGFFAIGLIEANGGTPVAVCVTSGSAVLNLAPAVSEAFYRSFPLLVITADRPQQWIGQMDGQTLPQLGAFGSMVSKCVSLPEPTDSESHWYCNRQVNEAIISLRRYSRPVQINVPVTEPFFDFSSAELPDERIITFHSTDDAPFTFTAEMPDGMAHSSSIILLIGQMLPVEMESIASFLSLLYEKGCIILAENLSNIHTVPELQGKYIGDFESFITFQSRLSVSASQQECSGVSLITLGGHIVSKPLKKYFRANPPQFHWHISPQGEVADLFMSLTNLVVATSYQFLKSLANLPLTCDAKAAHCVTEAFLNRSKQADSTPLSTLLSQLPSAYHIQVANSSMVRSLQRVFCGSNPVHCNRGVNGIEGSLSAAVGYWVRSNAPTLLLIGDLSFFYDQNGLWNNYVKNPSAPLRIFLLNNGCGDIFHHLPGLQSPYLDESIAAQHTTTAEGIALECHAHYSAVHSTTELAHSLQSFLDLEPNAKILEMFV